MHTCACKGVCVACIHGMWQQGEGVYGNSRLRYHATDHGHFGGRDPGMDPRAGATAVVVGHYARVLSDEHEWSRGERW
jgi:hypothetical protein